MARVLEGRNRASADEASSFVDEYEQFDEQVKSIMAKAMAEAKKVREEQKSLLEDAKGQGIPKKVIKTIADARRYEKKAKAKMEGLEDDDRTYAVDIRKALGDYADLPLGRVAVNKDDERTKAVVDAVKGSLTAKEKKDLERSAPAGSA